MGFDGAEEILIQPGTVRVPHTFEFPITTSAGAGDGTLPSDTAISGVAMTAWNAGTEITDLIHGTPTFTDDTVTAQLSYPTTTMSGVVGFIYPKFRFVLSLDNGFTVIEDDFDNVRVGDE